MYLDGGPSGSNDTWNRFKIEGFAGGQAAWIGLEEEGQPTDRRVLSASGAFVAVRQTRAAARVRILDHDRQVLDRWTFSATS